MSRDGSTLIISDRKHPMHIREEEATISYLPQPLIVATSHDLFLDDDMIAKQECGLVSFLRESVSNLASVTKILSTAGLGWEIRKGNKVGPSEAALLTKLGELIKKGNKVGPSEAALLTKLGIKSFSYGLVILSVYDNGSVLSPEVLNLTEVDLVDKFAVGVSVVASLSLTLSYPTLAAALHMFVNAYKNVLVVAVISIASAENATAIASKEKEKKDEPVGESDDDLGFSLFD
ncbi:60S acidic ribosomal protein P0-like [Asparagus officinalis]|uniref:60S acidic ribosomal protein P0-like n=1 Tax=Asparagus officinalis TaxID=4686 RepID=UPI00098E2A60|nr:60S acidic ribosomal protein P0-like [Asparagus officinalis]